MPIKGKIANTHCLVHVILVLTCAHLCIELHSIGTKSCIDVLIVCYHKYSNRSYHCTQITLPVQCLTHKCMYICLMYNTYIIILTSIWNSVDACIVFILYCVWIRHLTTKFTHTFWQLIVSAWTWYSGGRISVCASSLFPYISPAAARADDISTHYATTNMYQISETRKTEIELTWSSKHFTCTFARQSAHIGRQGTEICHIFK